MGVLPDWMIARDVKIEPFAEGQKREGRISYGNGSYGYDARIGYKFKVFSPIHAIEVDPKNFDPNALIEVDLTRYQNQENAFIRIPPHSFVLGETIETFKIPRDVLCIVVGKSTYARCGLIVNVTPGEPEWEGKWTVEISNTTPLPARVYAGEGIMQCIFLRTDGIREKDHEALRRLLHPGCGRIPVYTSQEYEEYHLATCEVSYADKKGKYQSQTGLTLPTVDKADKGES